MRSEKFNLFADEFGYNVDDIYSVTYFEDVFELENNSLIFRHIDIDFINGEFLEINDNDIRYKILMDIFSINKTDLKDGKKITSYYTARRKNMMIIYVFYIQNFNPTKNRITMNMNIICFHFWSTSRPINSLKKALG